LAVPWASSSLATRFFLSAESSRQFPRRLSEAAGRPVAVALHFPRSRVRTLPVQERNHQHFAFFLPNGERVGGKKQRGVHLVYLGAEGAQHLSSIFPRRPSGGVHEQAFTLVTHRLRDPGRDITRVIPPGRTRTGAH
jgi:hypothetical protein